MRNFKCNSIKGGGCTSFNQHYKSENSDEVFNNILQELGIECNLSDILDEYSEYVYKHEKQFEDECDSQFEDECDSQFEDCRDYDKKRKRKF